MTVYLFHLTSFLLTVLFCACEVQHQPHEIKDHNQEYQDTPLQNIN